MQYSQRLIEAEEWEWELTRRRFPRREREDGRDGEGKKGKKFCERVEAAVGKGVARVLKGLRSIFRERGVREEDLEEGMCSSSPTVEIPERMRVCTDQ